MSAGLRGRDKQQDDLVDAEADKGELPEGLQRKPVGPSDKDRERNEQATQENQIPSPGEPAGGE